MAYDRVLFDVGGVFSPDYWESLWLVETEGLADRLSISRHTAKAVGSRLWARFSCGVYTEREYWRSFSRELGRAIPMALVAAVEARTIVANPFAEDALGYLRSRDIRLGVVSDTTAFWFPKQARLVNLSSYLDPDLVFLSFERGVRKRRGTPDLYQLAADAVAPAQTLVVDDRPHNLDYAAGLGFQTLRYGHQRSLSTASDEPYVPAHFRPFQFDALAG